MVVFIRLDGSWKAGNTFLAFFGGECHDDQEFFEHKSRETRKTQNSGGVTYLNTSGPSEASDHYSLGLTEV